MPEIGLRRHLQALDDDDSNLAASRRTHHLCEPQFVAEKRDIGSISSDTGATHNYSSLVDKLVILFIV